MDKLLLRLLILDFVLQYKSWPYRGILFLQKLQNTNFRLERLQDYINKLILNL